MRQLLLLIESVGIRYNFSEYKTLEKEKKILACLFWTWNLLLLTYEPFHTLQVRAYAVIVLERADDEELQCYLLQLVQALRFERSDKSRLSQFLVQRCKSYFLFLTLQKRRSFYIKLSVNSLSLYMLWPLQHWEISSWQAFFGGMLQLNFMIPLMQSVSTVHTKSWKRIWWRFYFHF